jgi:hypothetical protein
LNYPALSIPRGSGALIEIPQSKLFSQELESDVSNQSADDGDQEIVGRNNVFDRENQALSLTLGGSKLRHQQVGVKKENNKRDFDYRS